MSTPCPYPYEILLIPRTCHASGHSSRICLVNPLDRVAKLQEGFVKGATVELERDFLGEGSLFPNSRDPGEPLWVLRPQNMIWKIQTLEAA